MNWFEHHIGDYDKNTSHLTACEDGIYSRLIRRYYDKEAPLPADVNEVKRLARARARDERAAVDAVLAEFFFLQEDGWHHKTIDEAIAAYRVGEPDRDAKKKNEEARLERHRAERRELFAIINGAGQHMAWNAPIADVRTAADRIRNGPETAPETAPETLQASADDAVFGKKNPATEPGRGKINFATTSFDSNSRSASSEATFNQINNLAQPATQPATATATATATPATATQPPTPTHHPPPTKDREERESASPESFRVSAEAAVVMALKAEGIGNCNPGHPDLQALLAAGAEVQNFVSAARTAVGAGKGSFAYVLGVVKGQLKDARALAAAGRVVPTRGQKPSRSDAQAAMLGALTGKINPTERSDDGARKQRAIDVEARRVD